MGRTARARGRSDGVGAFVVRIATISSSHSPPQQTPIAPTSSTRLLSLGCSLASQRGSSASGRGRRDVLHFGPRRVATDGDEVGGEQGPGWSEFEAGNELGN